MPPFVGRERELALLHKTCEHAVAARGSAAAVVLGDAGSGKSRLLAEFRDQTRLGSRYVITGFEPEQRIPLASARELFRSLRNVPSYGPSLESLVFGAAAHGVPEESLRVFEATHRALSAVGRALIVVDDLQWVDETSLALLHFLLRAAPTASRSLAVVACARPSPGTEAFVEQIGGLLAPEAVVMADLAPLDMASAVQLARALNPRLSQADAEDLWRATGGSPFWLEALAGTGDRGSDITNIVGRRLRGASQDVVDLFALLALAGRPLLLEEASEVQDWPLARLEAAASGLVRRGLAVEEEASLRTVHDLIRSAGEERVAVGRRRRVHQRLATFIELRAGEDPRPLLEALHHRREAGDPVEGVALEAASSPRRRLLGSEGLDQLLQIADAADPESTGGLALLEAVAVLATEIGAHSDALKRWSLIADLHPEPAHRTEAALAACRSAMELDRLGEAHMLLGRARSEGLSAVQQIEADALESALLGVLEHRLDEGRALGARALRSARRLAGAEAARGRLEPGLRRAYVRALTTAIDAARLEDDSARMLSLCEELIAVTRDLDYPSYLQALRSSGFALAQLGRVREAEDVLSRAWDGAMTHVFPSIALEVGWFYLRVLRDRGSLTRAHDIARECLSLAERVDQPGTIGFIRPHLLLTELSTGDWLNTVAGLRRGLAHERDPHRRIAFHQELGLAMARLGGSEQSEVVEQLRAARRDAEAAGCRRCRGELLIRGAGALARVGALEEAREWLQLAGSDDEGVKRLWREEARASISAAEGRSEDAARSLESVIASMDGELELHALWARLELAEIWLASNRRPKAATVLREAGAKAEAMGAINERRRAEQLLRSMQVRTWQRTARVPPATGLGDLTEREREIAQLVAEGATNRDIAGRLFLSPKTVERHVSNILAKMDVRNRVELAARMSTIS
jgi:DNA-binding CsgD family transcriptional regulator/tetratricopeptide (TPR) repeat protein